jgi:hypothetical protein
LVKRKEEEEEEKNCCYQHQLHASSLHLEAKGLLFDLFEVHLLGF